jgi:hypothetical protein
MTAVVLSEGELHDPSDLQVVFYSYSRDGTRRVSGTASYLRGDIEKLSIGRYRYTVPASMTSTLRKGRYQTAWKVITTPSDLDAGAQALYEAEAMQEG